MRYYGAHVSSAGGLQNAIINGDQLPINTIQIHPTAPQRWITKDLPLEPIQALIAEQQKHDRIKMVFAHGIYLSNLANPDKQKFHLSKMGLVVYLNFLHDLDQEAAKAKADIRSGGVVFHPGSAVHSPSQEAAIERIAKGVNWVMNTARGGTLLLEMSAGAGQVIGDTLEELAAIRQLVGKQDQVYYALDTQHMWASGYDWKNNLEQVVADVDRILGLDNVKLIHLNDSKTPFNSKKDRHEDLTKGEIGPAVEQIARHPKLAHIPMVLETPSMGKPDTAMTDNELLASWMKEA